jgi:hypothetical protein
MKSVARTLFGAAVTVTAIALLATPSDAATKKRMKGMAPGTYFGQLCTTPSVTANVGAVLVWGGDSKWYQSGWACAQPFCPAACT